jgi:hypothetical protein
VKAELTILRKSLLLKHMRIRGVQMGEGMGVWDGTARTSGASARGHATHHGTGLANLGPARLRDTRMHLLYHSRSRMSGVWMLSGHWVVARGHAMLHALMGGKRLRHHHCGGSQDRQEASKVINRESDEEKRPRKEAMCDGSSAPEMGRRSVLAFRGGGQDQVN